MPRKLSLLSLALLLAWILGAAAASAGDLAPSLPQAQPATPAPACQAESVALPAVALPAVAEAEPALTLPFLAPEPQAVAICPRIGCVNDEYCKRDRDCTSAPGGVCHLFCPSLGCCFY